ncbi:MAG TPA: hypothetical protein VFN92_10100 [Solirubrobacterales bacterium]|nr:hypothetical protein [Solirubrobacterales bacterium]
MALRTALSASSDWTDVVRRLSKGFGRGPARAMQVTHWITGSQTTDFRIVSKRLEDYQRIRFRLLFKQGIDTVRDGSNCDVARRRPYFNAGKWHYHPQCKKAQDLCDQPTFLAARRERAEAASKALLASKRKADSDMGKKALAALRSDQPGATKGKACHGANGIGGDIAIALECEQDEVLLTTDESFDLICPALGLKHQRI